MLPVLTVPAMLTARLMSGLWRSLSHHREAKTGNVAFLKLPLPWPGSHCFPSSSMLDTFISAVPATRKLCTVTLHLTWW